MEARGRLTSAPPPLVGSRLRGRFGSCCGNAAVRRPSRTEQCRLLSRDGGRRRRLIGSSARSGVRRRLRICRSGRGGRLLRQQRRLPGRCGCSALLLLCALALRPIQVDDVSQRLIVPPNLPAPITEPDPLSCSLDCNCRSRSTEGGGTDTHGKVGLEAQRRFVNREPSPSHECSKASGVWASGAFEPHARSTWGFNLDAEEVVPHADSSPHLQDLHPPGLGVGLGQHLTGTPKVARILTFSSVRVNIKRGGGAVSSTCASAGLQAWVWGRASARTCAATEREKALTGPPWMR